MASRSHSSYESDVVRLIDRLYEAATAPSAWPAFLRGFCEATDSEFAVLVSQHGCRPGEQMVWQQHLLSDEADEGYLQWSHKKVYVDAAIPRMHVGATFPGAALSTEDTTESEFCDEFLRYDADVLDTMSARIFTESALNALFVSCRDSAKPGYGPTDRSLLSSLVPHLERVIVISSRLGQIELERAASAETLDRLASGVFFLDERGRVLLSNTTAQRIIAECDGLSLDREGQLCAATADETASIRKLIGSACSHRNGNGGGSGGALQIYRPSERRPYVLSVSHLRLRQFALIGRRPSAVIFVTDADRELGDPSILDQVYGLTRAERRVARLLARGCRVADIVERLDVSEATTRTHVRHILTKAHADGQADLVRILVSSLLGHGGEGDGLGDPI